MDKIHKSFCANSVNFFTKCFYYMSQNDLRFVTVTHCLQRKD